MGNLLKSTNLIGTAFMVMSNRQSCNNHAFIEACISMYMLLRQLGKIKQEKTKKPDMSSKFLSEVL